MKALILALALSAAPAYAQMCGIPPLPPMGCTGQPVCICSGSSCTWVYTQCR